MSYGAAAIGAIIAGRQISTSLEELIFRLGLVCTLTIIFLGFIVFLSYLHTKFEKREK